MATLAYRDIFRKQTQTRTSIPKQSVLFPPITHVFLRVTPVTGVGRTLKSKKLTSRFIGLYQISDRVGNVAYKVALPPNLSNLHDVLHVSQLRKYILGPSRVIHMDDVQVRDNLTVETVLVRIADREMKTLRVKESALVKVVWLGASRESMM